MHDGFMTPAQAMYWASQEHLSLSLFLARSGWTQNVSTQTITVDGTEDGAFELTAAPLAVVAVHQLRSGRYRPVAYNNYVDFQRQPAGGQVTGDPTEWHLVWDASEDTHLLHFYPEPPSGTVLVVSYIAEPDRLTLDDAPAEGYANSVNYPMGWEERIVLGMARRALAKEESDTSDIRAQISECDQRIEEACWNRVLAESPTVRNVDPGRQYRTYPPPTQWVFV